MINKKTVCKWVFYRAFGSIINMFPKPNQRQIQNFGTALHRWLIQALLRASSRETEARRTVLQTGAANANVQSHDILTHDNIILRSLRNQPPRATVPLRFAVSTGSDWFIKLPPAPLMRRVRGKPRRAVTRLGKNCCSVTGKHNFPLLHPQF